jgi:hypothetical protein
LLSFCPYRWRNTEEFEIKSPFEDVRVAVSLEQSQKMEEMKQYSHAFVKE